MSVAAMWHVHVALPLMFTSRPGGERESLHHASTTTVSSWPDLFERALAGGDEHAIKFTEACYRENTVQPDPRFPAALNRIGSLTDG